MHGELQGLIRQGINNFEQRGRYKSKVICTETAKNREYLILNEYKKYLFNTGKLNSGNTETLWKPPVKEIIKRIKQYEH